jgi:hypothetical protein
MAITELIRTVPLIPENDLVFGRYSGDTIKSNRLYYSLFVAPTKFQYWTFIRPYVKKIQRQVSTLL